MMRKNILILLCCMAQVVQAEQFIYPVADFDHGNQLVVMYQKSLQDIELWFLNQSNQTMSKGLSSFLIPANLRILPSGDGFSFIDSGYIKIKKFTKRSPKTLAIYEPISFFSSMNWIDEHTFYFTAREGDFYQIFYGDDESNIFRLSCEPIDSLYPQKINDNFYCIKRNEEGQFKIVMQPWLPVNFMQHQILNETIILPETDKPLCFLHMIDDSQGFFLQAPSFKNFKEDDVYEFICHQLIKIDDQWQSQELFKFNIPCKYIHGPYRLYESIEPFLPNYTMEDYIYFSNYNQQLGFFELSKFHTPTKIVTILNNDNLKKNGTNSNQLFAPYIINSKINCGTILLETKFVDFSQKNFVFKLAQFDTK